jgi:4,5-dihydroxyphthalate decarboxylase
MRELYVDFAWGLSPFGRYAYQDDEVRFGRDPYPSGIAANRDNLDWFIGYHVDQHIIPRRLSLEELFHPSVLDT